MKVSTHHYRLPLRAPLMLKDLRHAERRGCLLRIEDAGGRAGWGDCAPLPGFSSESLDAAAEQLGTLAAFVEGMRPDPAWFERDHPLHTEIEDLELYPSARFALELALLDLAAQQAGRPLPDLLHSNPKPEVPINALITSDDGEALLEEAEARVVDGYRTLKLKVGRRPVEEDVERVRALRRRLGTDIALRCDANRAWPFAEAAAFADGVFGLGLEYVEEPLAESVGHGALWLEMKLPVALDESLAAMDPSDLEARAYLTAVVLKPTLLGGMLRTLRFAEEARRLGIRVVISGAFESGVAMRAHVALAAATGGEPAGLDPYNRLAEDVLRPRLPLDRPSVDVPALFRSEHQVTLLSE